MLLLPRSYSRLCAALLALFMLCLSVTGHADDRHLIERVHAFLYEHAMDLGNEVNIEVHPPSAHLPICESPDPFLPHAGQSLVGRVSVGVRCGSQGRQVRYLQANVSVIGDQVVAARAIPAGTVITADMLALRPAELGRLARGTLTRFEDAIGLQASRPFAAGAALSEQTLKPVTLIERGARVRVEARGNGFAVMREGQALEPGAMGDEIRIRLDNRETLRARVAGRNRLLVDF
ncbi:flagellar basal body P-ring formation chaperone FlgA [Litchfieldella xinjiangensis]|uniref:flagellar basal body P-ring formation chaperone FlgA n=1 Tax=Litchfieldella xinjiangensis TaxID=1166948 RepID=UPI0006939225|nr:flagellar basal body P-ring formation chaperone FlgA [Halomonas xinjiangensis]